MIRFLTDKSGLQKVTWEDGWLHLYFVDSKVTRYEGVPEGLFEGMRLAPSPGSYLNRYINGKYPLKVIQNKAKDAEYVRLLHHKDTTVGLWATDKPELIPEDIKEMFFEITFEE